MSSSHCKGEKTKTKPENIRLLPTVPNGLQVQSPPSCSCCFWYWHCPTPYPPYPHPSLCAPCPWQPWPGAISHCGCTHSPAQGPLQPTHSHTGMLRAPTTSTGTDRQTDSKAHPPPLIRLRSESTSSAPSMATSSCGKRRKLVWKPLLCSIQALLPMQLRGWWVPSSSHKCHQSWEHLGASLSRASDGPPKDTLRPPKPL